VPKITDYKDRFADAMKQAGATEHTVAKALGISYQAVKKVLLGTTRMLKADHNVMAAKFLQVDSEWLATGEGEARGARVWPLSQELLQAIQSAQGDQRLTVENTARSVLKLKWTEQRAEPGGQGSSAEPTGQSRKRVAHN
jgi:transcriptional regulator with XRE-family HTH domain